MSSKKRLQDLDLKVKEIEKIASLYPEDLSCEPYERLHRLILGGASWTRRRLTDIISKPDDYRSSITYESCFANKVADLLEWAYVFRDKMKQVGHERK